MTIFIVCNRRDAWKVKPWSHVWLIAARLNPVSVAGNGDEYFYSSWTRWWSIVGSSPAIRLYPFILLGQWREALWELSVLFKNTTQCSRPGLEQGRTARPWDERTRPSHLTLTHEKLTSICFFFLITNCQIILSFTLLISWSKPRYGFTPLLIV